MTIDPEDTFIASVPQEIQELLVEQEELKRIFPPVYVSGRYGKIQYKIDNLTGVLLDNLTGCVQDNWGDISEYQILQAQRLWAIDQQLATYAREQD